MSAKKTFDHGGFWDHYSSRWDPDVEGGGAPDGVLGVEWTQDHRTRFVVENFALPFIDERSRVLEIGPGGGKFSRALEQRARELVLADISPKMLERAAAACETAPRTVLLDGTSLDPLEDQSFDAVFSYDVFIHLESEEVFRYFAEINRVLRLDGTFIVHTSTYESRCGFQAYLRQICNHTHLLGQRYGGRMYPMSRAIVERFADNSGFTVERVHGDWEDRDLIFALRKTRLALPWRFLSNPRLVESIEIMERMGGSNRRELYAAHDRKRGILVTLLTGAEGDPWVRAAADLQPPEHPGLPRPLAYTEEGGIAWVTYENVRGPSLTDVLRFGLPTLHSERSLRDIARGLVDTVYQVHEHGLVHGELSTASVFLDVVSLHPRLVGVVDPAAAGLDPEAARAADVRGLIGFLRAVPRDAARSEALEPHLAALAAEGRVTAAVGAAVGAAL